MPPNSSWKIDFNEGYPEDFIAWINSINKDFRTRIDYEPLNVYCKQAHKWLKEESFDYEDLNEQEKKQYRTSEIKKIRENTLYFLDKYHIIKDGDAPRGFIDFKAYDAHKILAFLFDQRLSLLIGKARQIFFTSTMGGCFVKRTMFFGGYYALYVADDEKKGQKIFKDKIRYSVFRVPKYLRPNVRNVRDGMLGFGSTNLKKGGVGDLGLESTIEVIAPKKYSITGEAPNLTGLDEIALNNDFSTMLGEMRPALFRYNPLTDKLERGRQLIAWGTGGAKAGGAAAFEQEWNSAKQAWQRGDWKYGLVPIFFDVYARPGMTQEHYDEEMRIAYSSTGPDGEDKRIQFHIHHPINEQDMFLSTSKTLIPMDEINTHLNRIYAGPAKELQYGFFEPIYDVNSPTENSDLPYKLIGANFKPTSGPEDPLTTSIITEHPEPWKNRYYKGTDPISAETGQSLMSSTILDALKWKVSCIVNWRIRDYKQVFLQSLLAGIYYDKNIKELVEINNGQNYVDYVDHKGYYYTLVANRQLDVHIQIPSGPLIGINNKANVSKHIIYALQEMLDAYAGNIDMPEVFIQLKTFVEKALTSGKVRYQAEDLKYYRDDILYSLAYAYICAKCYSRYKPEELDQSTRKKVVRKYAYDPSMTLRLADVDEDGKILRFLN